MKLEITVNEYHIQIEGLNRTVQDMTSQKQKLQFEAQEANKKLNDMKLAIEHAGMDKNKFTTQLEELRRAADTESRNRNAAETKITALERNIKVLTVEIEELRQIKINLEASITKWQAENADWKKKYENEARLRVEEVDALKKKFHLEITSLTDNLHNLEQKLKAAENAKAKLTSEVGVLVKDFEHSQVVIKELTAKLGSSDKTCNDLAIKLKEMTNLYEKADRDSKARAQDVVKMGNEMDRVKMANESLTQVKAKLEDELKSFKTEMDALKKRFADLDRDNRKVVHEREELARAYKKSDDEKAKALNQVQLLEKELAKLKAEFEKTFGGARSEYEAYKKKLVDEINVLSRKLAEAESRLKNEVEVIKKKMSITITELEMSLDASNKSNAQLQNTCKVQNEKIMQLTELDVSYKKITADYNKSLTVIKDYELKLNGFNGKVNELTTANNQLVMVKTKLEKEFGQVSKDYDDIARELKLADDRANKAGSDAHHFESLLREEQAKLVKIDQAKKSLENEVRSLSVRIEEIETNSVATSKRTIQKMEVRIEELEVMINNEKKSHAATMTELHTKTRSIKELILQSEEDRKNIIILQDSLDKLNEKIKMYKKQLEEQETISNSNIMRVKNFQRELESAENRAEEAESTLSQFRSRERVFASASARAEKTTDVQESEVVVKKTINKVSVGGAATSSSAAFSSSQESSSALQSSDIRAGSVAYSRAGSVARAGGSSSSYRASSMAASRAGSMSRSVKLRHPVWASKLQYD